jgi:hypothetical protein
MAQSILIIADSGTGKSTAIRELDSKETFIINVAGKGLPFKGWKKNYTAISKDNPKGNLSNVSSAGGIMKAMQHINDKMSHIKTIVIDDFQYMASFEYFDRAKEKGYDKFTDIATNIASVSKLPKDMRDDLNVYYLTHPEEVNRNGSVLIKAKTVGKMIDNALTLEGLFTIVLFGKVIKEDDGSFQYGFETQTDGDNTCKSPAGMFEERFIPNNLKYVNDAIKAYEE